MRISKGLPLLALLAVTTPLQAEQLLVNGGFESGDFSGWTQSGNTGYTSVASGLAHSGYFSANLGPIGSPGVLSQTLATAAGTPLNLSFQLASDGLTPNAFGVSLAGINVQLNNIPLQGFKQYTFDTIAADTTTTLALGFQNDPGYLRLDDVSVTTNPNDPVVWPAGTPPGDGCFPVIDPIPPGGPDGSDPGVRQTPEPASLTLLLLGALGLAIVGRFPASFAASF